MNSYVEGTTTLNLQALQIYPTKMRLVPALRTRRWIEETDQRFATRCLPMLMANQSAWFILNHFAFCATWNGMNDKAAISIQASAPVPHDGATSHFGCGILTWTIPYLFRTSPGYNLLVRGPANLPKDGISPLEGIVETDWACATFTMN